MKIKKIRWEDGQYGFRYGYIGKIRLFSMSYSNEGYGLTSYLPMEAIEKIKTVKYAEKQAEEYLEKLINFLTEKEEK